MNIYIEQLNESLPTVKEIQDNFKRKAGKELNDNQANAYRAGMVIVYEKEIEAKNEIEDLILNTNLPFISIGSLNFKSVFEEIKGDLVQFAEYNDDIIKLCLSYKNNKIYILNEDFNETEIAFEDYDLFKEFLTIYQNLYIRKVFRGEKLNKKEKERLKLLINKGVSFKVVQDLIGEII